MHGTVPPLPWLMGDPHFLFGGFAPSYSRDERGQSFPYGGCGPPMIEG